MEAVGVRSDGEAGLKLERRRAVNSAMDSRLSVGQKNRGEGKRLKLWAGEKCIGGSW